MKSIKFSEHKKRIEKKKERIENIKLFLMMTIMIYGTLVLAILKWIYFGY